MERRSVLVTARSLCLLGIRQPESAFVFYESRYFRLNCAVSWRVQLKFGLYFTRCKGYDHSVTGTNVPVEVEKNGPLTMATRKTTTDQTQTELERIAALQAEQKRLTAQIKEAEAALSPLDKVIARQEATPANPILLSRVKGRIGAGQERDEAIDAVLEMAREWLVEALESEAE
jgi:hypothetical protein